MKGCSNLNSSFFLLVLACIMMTVSYNFCTNYELLVVEVEVMSSSCVGISFPLVLDWVGLFFSSAVVLISGCVMMFSSFYMDHEEFPGRFVGLVMLFVLSMNFLIFIPSVFGLMVGWDGLGVISFLLVIYYQNKSSLGAGMITVLTNRIGDVLFIISIGLLSGVMSWNFVDLSDWSLILMVVGFLIVGSMTKSAQIPFSAWLPAAMAAPTPVSALVHSSTLVTAGVYVMVRFSSSAWGSWGLFLLIMSVLTVVMAGLSASFEADLKKVIALSTLSQLGMMMLIVSVGAMGICVFHLVTHALFKALMFLCAGAVIHLSGGIQDIRCFSGLWYKLPITNSWLVVSCFSLMGVPFMAGFYSKDLILEFCLSGSMGVVLTILLTIGTFLTAFYSVRFLFLVMSGLDFSCFFNFNQLSFSLVVSSSVLGLGAIFGGAFFQTILVDMNVFVFMPAFIKLSIPFSVVSGVIFSLLVFSMGFKVLDMKLSYYSSWWYKLVKWSMGMNSKMWFLPMLSGIYWSNPLLFLGSKVLLSLDNGWVEAGIGSMSGCSSQLSMLNSKAQVNMVGVYFCVGLVLFSLLVFGFNLISF